MQSLSATETDLFNKSRQILPKTHPKGVHSGLEESETPVLQSLPPYFMVIVGGIPVHQDYLRFWRAKDVHLTASIPALCWLNSSELVVVLQNISSATRCNQGTRKFWRFQSCDLAVPDFFEISAIPVFHRANMLGLKIFWGTRTSILSSVGGTIDVLWWHYVWSWNIRPYLHDASMVGCTSKKHEGKTAYP